MLWPRTVRQAETAWRWLVVSGRIVITAATAASTVSATVKTQVNPDLPLAWLFVPLSIATAGSIIDTGTKTVRAKRAPRREEDMNDVRQAAVQAHQEIARVANVPAQGLGVCVWEVRHYRPFLRKPRLHRIVRFRLTLQSAPSDVDWTAGKGVIGAVWRTKTRKHVDWRGIASRWGRGLTDDDWAKIPSDTKFGFDRDEFEEICGKYAEVLAVPIKDGTTGSLLGRPGRCAAGECGRTSRRTPRPAPSGACR